MYSYGIGTQHGYDFPGDGEVRVRKVKRGWIVTNYFLKEPEKDPITEEALKNLRTAVDNTWDPKEASVAASDILYARADSRQPPQLVKEEAVFEEHGALVAYLGRLTSSK